MASFKLGAAVPPPVTHAAPAAPLRLPPPPGFDDPGGQGTAGAGEWDFDDDDDEPTRAFNPGMVPRGGIASAPAPTAPLQLRSSAPPDADGAGWRDRVQQLRTKAVESFEELKKKSGDQLRKLSSRPPPPAAVSVQPVAVQAEAPDFRRGRLAQFKPKKARAALLAAAVVAAVVLVWWHRDTRQRQEALENDLTQARPLLWSSDVNEVKKISTYLDQSFEVTSYGSLANGFASTLGFSEEPLFVSLEPEAEVLALRQYTVLRLLDPSTDPKLLEKRVSALKETEAPQERVGFVKLLPALEGKPDDAEEAEELDTATKKDPVALLLSGILLERVGRVEEAAKRYVMAGEAEPVWHLPKVYRARLALLTRGAQGAKPELEAMREAARVDPNLGVVSRALNALDWVVDSGRSRELPDQAKLEAAEVSSLPPVLATVPELVRLVQAMLDEKDDLKELLTRAIKNADGPALLVQLAGLAADVNQGEMVDEAIDRVQEFAKGYAPAKALAARMQLRKGDFAAARQTAKAAGLDTSSIDAVEAYEQQDAKTLQDALDAMPSSDKQKPEYAALLAADGILTGAEYPSPGKLQDFVETNSLWGELIAADAALDQGDLGRAGKIIEEWAEPERTALHEIRIARYERYKGRFREAVKLSKDALDKASTSNRALIEHINALLADDRLADAVKLYGDALYKDLLKPHERWVDALLVGKDKGWMAANVITSYLQPPGSDEALSLRLLALRAMSVAGDPRAGVHLQRMAKELPRNPDYLTAQSEY